MLQLDAKVAMRCNFGELITEKRESIIRNSKVWDQRVWVGMCLRLRSKVNQDREMSEPMAWRQG